jgi:hypothetical protein
MLSRCTFCSGPGFATVRLELDRLPGSAATYIVCTQAKCIARTSERVFENLSKAALPEVKVDVDSGDVIDVDGVAIDVKMIGPH